MHGMQARSQCPAGSIQAEERLLKRKREILPRDVGGLFPNVVWNVIWNEATGRTTRITLDLPGANLPT